jgi:replication factor C large subunit
VWTEKYRPKSLEDFKGNAAAIKEIRVILGKKPVLLYGPTGTGKSTLCDCLANELGIEKFEINASDVRSKAALARVKNTAFSVSLSGKPKLIVIDELDGLSAVDRGAAGEISQIIESSVNPVILITNDRWDKKLSSLRKKCVEIGFKRLRASQIAKVLKKICENEGISCALEVLEKMAQDAGGDLKAAINDLELVAAGKKKLGIEDFEVLKGRDHTRDIFHAMRDVFKSESFMDARVAIRNLTESPDFIEKWIDENIALEYEKPAEVGRAYEKMAKSDMYFGRIGRRQDWGLMKYAIDMMTAGVAMAKEKPYHKFTRYSFPSLIRKLAVSKRKRAVRDSLGKKVGGVCHIGKRRALIDYLPLLKELFKDDRKAVELTKVFGLSEDEVVFLGQDWKKVSKSLEGLREAIVKEKMTGKQLTLADL